VDPKLAAAGYAPLHDEAACKVEITLKNGQRFSNSVNLAKGSKKNPMSDTEMEEKFRSCCRGIFNTKKIEGIIATIRDLDNIPDIRQLTGLLGATR
jgi:2-methylcitrate dehydratase PrpD